MGSMTLTAPERQALQTLLVGELTGDVATQAAEAFPTVPDSQKTTAVVTAAFITDLTAGDSVAAAKVSGVTVSGTEVRVAALIVPAPYAAKTLWVAQGNVKKSYHAYNESCDPKAQTNRWHHRAKAYGLNGLSFKEQLQQYRFTSEGWIVRPANARSMSAAESANPHCSAAIAESAAQVYASWSLTPEIAIQGQSYRILVGVFSSTDGADKITKSLAESYAEAVEFSE